MIMANELSYEELVKKVQELEFELKSTKKYGLVWDKEDTKEDVVLKCEKEIPVLTQDKNKKIICDSGENNILIEGDNYHALTALNFVAKESIDVIYIDPPYNTGHEDFAYNDNYVNADDGYRHSKWLSFMEKRLLSARELLNNEGIIFISIDDNEQSQLKLLCDNVFGENNFIANCFVLDNLKGKSNDNFISSVGSRLLVYAKNKYISNFIGFSSVENIFGDKIEEKYVKEDEFGYYNLVTFKKTGQSKYREDRPLMFYPILEKNNKLFSIRDDEFVKIYDKTSKTFNDEFLKELKEKYLDFNFILPLDSDGKYLRWTSGFNTYKKKMNNEIIYDSGVKQKTRPEAAEMLQIYASGRPKTFMYKPNYSTGTDDLKNVIGINNFDFPKPVQLISDILKLILKKDFTVLDFFAGSGTTGQAVMELNKEDGGHRRFILCTNNENNICTDVTYPRIKTIITGIKSDGSKYSDGLPNNLYYFKTDFVKDENNTEQARYCLVEKVDGLLCIAENIFDEVERNSYSSHYSSKDRHLFIYNDYYSPETFEEFKNRVINCKGERIVYIYSSDNNVDETLFEDKAIQLKPIPMKIYEIYKEIVEEIKRGE